MLTLDNACQTIGPHLLKPGDHVIYRNTKYELYPDWNGNVALAGRVQPVTDYDKANWTRDVTVEYYQELAGSFQVHELQGVLKNTSPYTLRRVNLYVIGYTQAGAIAYVGIYNRLNVDQEDTGLTLEQVAPGAEIPFSIRLSDRNFHAVFISPVGSYHYELIAEGSTLETLQGICSDSNP